MVNMFLLLPFLLISAVQILLYGLTRKRDHKMPLLLNLIRCISYVNCALAIYAICLLVNNPLRELTLFSYEGLGISIRIDRLNTVLFTMISIIGLVVSRFSASYLQGNKSQLHFMGITTGIIGSIQLFVLSGNILLLFASWVITSLLLQKLLTFYPEREKAQRAAKKKFILARFGDLTLFCSLALIFSVFKTGDLNSIFSQLQLPDLAYSGRLQLAAILLVITAILKSAQLPFHGWLIEVTEAPTPVSALLHAGLINSGPYLIIRFAPLIQLSDNAQVMLFSVGLLTAVFGSYTFIYQSSVKNALGYSSIAHMGFTLMLCGIGAYSAALLHLTAHSFYKAHAFLSSGSEIEMTTPNQQDKKQTSRHTWIFISGSVLSLIIGITAGYFIGFYFNKHPFTLGVIYLFICISVSSMVAKTFTSATLPGTFLRISLLSIAALFSFLLFETAFQQLVATQVLEKIEPSSFIFYTTIGMLIIFTLLILINTLKNRLVPGKLKHKLAIHLKNGLYIDLFINRLMGAYRK